MLYYLTILKYMFECMLKEVKQNVAVMYINMLLLLFRCTVRSRLMLLRLKLFEYYAMRFPKIVHYIDACFIYTPTKNGPLYSDDVYNVFFFQRSYIIPSGIKIPIVFYTCLYVLSCLV